jgi:uncharacterized protein YxeA
VITLKKSLIIAIIIILIAIGGGAYWYFYVRTPSEESTSPTATEESESGSFVGSIADALKAGTAMKCTWSYQGEDATFYIKGQKYYGEITTAEAGTLKYIYRDNCTYYWQKGESQGTKLCFTPTEGEEEEYDASELESVDASAAALGYEYSCQTEVITDSRFTLPSGVEFLDLSQYLQQYMTP